jgi:transcription termination factor NusB
VEVEKQVEAPERLQRIVSQLPLIDPSVGAAVSQTWIPDSEKLLVVVRYAHANERAFQEVGPEARLRIIESQEQVIKMLGSLSTSLGVTSFTGDGLLPTDAAEINKALKYLKGLRAQLGDLIDCKSADDLVVALKSRCNQLAVGDKSHQQLQQLINGIEDNKEKFDRILENCAAARAFIEELAKTEPIVRVAHEKGFSVFSTENPELHARTLAEALGEHRQAVIEKLNEERENAIMDMVAASHERVTILVMGAMHRFDDNARSRAALAAHERISVIEYNPRALPDNLEELFNSLTR